MERPDPHPLDRFHRAVRSHESVGKLEDLRSQVYFDWEDDPEDRSYSPSDALRYCVIHNHVPYARYLLSHFPEESIKVPGLRHLQCPRYALHLGLAITHNRREILTAIIEASQRILHLRPYINMETYFYPVDGRTPLHLACELLRSDLFLILLRYGAKPRPDLLGKTPADVVLTKLWSSKDNMKRKIQCLDYLLLFAPPGTLQMRRSLKEHSEYWRTLLGEDLYTFLIGETPAPLALLSMKKVLQQLAPDNLLISIQRLPIPQNLKNMFSFGD
ncbi:hypothetical protein GDO81_023522 [Engystomops pustulosus]|uniref:Ankyrin repeat domain-containing protein 9 n=1 Tax=Engystomops pustulosus TaxID=76066 RepID=A0AAV6YLY5_ENGPU|nr:hypothetical protein GDO81_023522 [Engystomops pustulosus]